MYRSKSRLITLSILTLIISLLFVSPSFADDSNNFDPADVPTYYAQSIGDLSDALYSGYDTVALGSGTWNVSRTIFIPAGVTLDLNGQIVSSSADYAFALNGDGASITNGTINNGGIRVTADDTTGSIFGVTINEAPECGIRLSSSSIGSITNNTIRDGRGMGIYLYSNSSCGDITNNTITGCADHAVRLSGNSGASSNNGSVAGDIAYNTITSCKGHGISLYNGSHCGKIDHNKLRNIGGANGISPGDFAIAVNAGSCYETYAAEVTYNEIDGVTMAGIVVFSGPHGKSTTAYQDYGHIKGDIAYNTISNNATAKKKVNWKNQKSSDPVCEGAIYVDCHATVCGSIHHNTINTTYDDGINILAYSSVPSIYSNTINNASNSGISVKNNSTVDVIRNNKVTGAKRYGIFINSNSKVTDRIYGNKITRPGETGLAVLAKSSVKAFTRNTITGAKLYGVLAGGSGSQVTTLSSNTITTSNKKEGYAVFCNSGCRISQIKSNDLSGKYLAGIRVKSPSGKILVQSNKLVSKSPSTSRSVGMSIDGCKKGITIKSNKITGNRKGPGIYIKSSKSVIKSNSFSKVSKKIQK